jgi:rod shape-determining protein MreC
VITPDGVVGKTTTEVFADTAQILLLSDKESGVGALLAESRTQGVVRGQGEPWLLLDYVVSDEPMRAGQLILTTGQDQIFPKGLPLGTVLDVTPGTPYPRIRVKPAARLDRLEEVLVLLTREELKPTTQAAKAEASNPKAEAATPRQP